MKKPLFLLMILSSLLLASCSGRNSPDDKEIVVGASPTPHAVILEHAKTYVEEAGYKLTVKVYDDYVTPNPSLQSGDLDANYFQHVPYLTDFNQANGTDLVSVMKVHFEPMGIYSTKHTDLFRRENMTIAIPNDVSNGDRARALISIVPTLDNVTIIEAEAQTLPALLQDVDYACINGNYALSAEITDKCLYSERSDSVIANTNANVIAVKRENKDKPFVTVLCDAIKQCKSFIEKTFGDSVKVVF